MFSKISKILLILTVFTLISVVWCCLYVFAGPEDPINNPGSDIQICTELINKDGCCSGFLINPVLPWSVTSVSGESQQIAYWLQVDDNDDFLSPEIDTGEIISSINFYTIQGEYLEEYRTYYWRVGVKDNFYSWTDWAEGESFEIPMDCTCDPNAYPDIFPTEFPWSEFQICTDLVTQPDCYDGDFPVPVLNWIFSSVGESSQVAYWLQIDNNDDFLSPEFDTGAISSAVNYHQVCADSLEFDSTYYWKVTAGDNKGTWVNWTSPGEIFVTAPSCFPYMPIIGDIINLDNLCYGVKVEWADNSYNEIGFNVQVKTDISDWDDFCSVNPDITSCSASLYPNVSYYFRVKALGEDGDSEWSPDDSGQEYGTSYCVPVLSLGQCNCDEVNLNWEQIGWGVDHYEVWRKMHDNRVDSNYWMIIADDIPNTQFTYIDTDISSGASYQYKIQVEDQESNIESVKPCPNLPLWKEVGPSS